MKMVLFPNDAFIHDIRRKSPILSPMILSVSRRLFGPVDRQQNKSDLRVLNQRLLEQANDRWDFDFEAGKPIRGGRYDWLPADETRGFLKIEECPELDLLSVCFTHSPHDSPHDFDDNTLTTAKSASVVISSSTEEKSTLNRTSFETDVNFRSIDVTASHDSNDSISSSIKASHDSNDSISSSIKASDADAADVLCNAELSQSVLCCRQLERLFPYYSSRQTQTSRKHCSKRKLTVARHKKVQRSAITDYFPKTKRVLTEAKMGSKRQSRLPVERRD